MEVIAGRAPASRVPASDRTPVTAAYKLSLCNATKAIHVSSSLGLILMLGSKEFVVSSMVQQLLFQCVVQSGSC